LLDENNYWTNCAQIDVSGTSLENPLASLTKKDASDNDVKLDLSHIYIVGFWSFGGFSPISIKRIWVSYDDTTDIAAVIDKSQPSKQNTIYSIIGRCLSAPQRGINISAEGRKLIMQGWQKYRIATAKNELNILIMYRMHNVT
jgi:hypothetical protein